MRFHKRSRAILLAIIVVLAGCSSPRQDSPASVLMTPLPDWREDASVRGTGRVVLTRQADVSFLMSGEITTWLVKEGDQVHQGDVLARMDSTILELELAQAQSSLAVAQANLDTAVARTDPALLDLPGSAAIARAEVAHAQTIVEEAKAQLALATLVAPMDGVVTAIYVQQYEFASVGTPVAQLGDMTAMQVRAEIGETDAAGIAVGNTVSVTFDSAPGVVVHGLVTRITPQFSSNDSPKFVVIIDLLEVPKAVQWGTTANVMISTQ